MDKNRRDEDALTLLIARFGMFGAQTDNHKVRPISVPAVLPNSMWKLFQSRMAFPQASANCVRHHHNVRRSIVQESS